MAEQGVSRRTGEPFSGWGSSPQDAFVAILNNAGKGQQAPRGPVRTRGFVVLARNTEGLQAVQEWCLQQRWNDCLAARYRIDSKPVFGTLFAALSDDSKQMQSEGSASPGMAAKRRGSLLFRPEGDWPRLIANGFFEDPAYVSNVAVWLDGRRGTTSYQGTMLGFLAEGVLTAGRRLVLLAEVLGEPDPPEWDAAEAGLFELLPERVGLVLAGAPEAFSLPSDPHYLELDLAGIEMPPSGVEAYVYQFGALSSDRPSYDDRLGVRHYADALARFVLHPGTTPLTVAIHGPWGKGKSSFMQLVRQSLLRVAAAEALDAPTAQVELEVRTDGHLKRPGSIGRLSWRRALGKVRRRIVTAEFNAWRYQDSTQIWAGLASAITSALEAALPWWRRLLTPLAYAWRNRRAELIIELGLPTLIAALILVLVAVGIPPLRDWLDQELESNALAKLLGGVLPAVGAVVGSFWVVASRTRRVLQPVSERVLTYVRRPDYREQMGYQHQVLEDLRFVVRRLRGDTPEPRAVVFIDDLDRCSVEKIMEILQAINLILGESEFYVFLGIDTRMIYRAIDAHFAAEGRPPEPRFAETYLQKIVQLPFHLPETRPEQRASFVAELFGEAARQGAPGSRGAAAGVAEGAPPPLLAWDRDALLTPEVQTPKPVEDTPIELQAFLDFLPYLEDNPRELKRLVNIHRFVKIVLQQEGRPPSVEVQRKLVKWLVFCDHWPDLVDEALGHARDHPGSSNCITEALARVDAEAAAFGTLAVPQDVLTAYDLAPDGPLANAASISHLIVWESGLETEDGTTPRFTLAAEAPSNELGGGPICLRVENNGPSDEFEATVISVQGSTTAMPPWYVRWRGSNDHRQEILTGHQWPLEVCEDHVMHGSDGSRTLGWRFFRPDGESFVPPDFFDSAEDRHGAPLQVKVKVTPRSRPEAALENTVTLAVTEHDRSASWGSYRIPLNA